MFAVVTVFALVDRVVLPFENSSTFHPTLIERTLVLSVWQGEPTLSLEQILLEVALISCTVWEQIAALAMFGSIEEVPFIVRTILPLLFSLSVRQIIQPLASVGVVLLVIDKLSLSLSYVMPNLSLIVASATEDITSISMGEAVSKGALVVGAIFKEKLSNPMRFVVLPLSFIDGLSGLNQEGGSWITFHPT